MPPCTPTATAAMDGRGEGWASVAMDGHLRHAMDGICRKNKNSQPHGRG